jgi:predicted SAM-dependent methyltransferase
MRSEAFSSMRFTSSESFIGLTSGMKQLLHVGCGPKRKNRTTAAFNAPEWNEIRLDIDASVQPDVIGTMTDMASVATRSVDAIYSSHNIEHLYPHTVATMARPAQFDLWTVASKSQRTEVEMSILANAHFPPVQRK